MTECESFEVEIEIAWHDSLECARAEALGRHVEVCTSCRHYQALVRQTEQTMGAQAKTLDFNALDARVGRLHRDLRGRFWLPVALLSALTVPLCVLTARPFPVLLSMGATALLVFSMFWIRVTLEAREIAQAGREKVEFLAFYRRLLERRIRLIKVVTALMPLFMIESFAQWRLAATGPPRKTPRKRPSLRCTGDSAPFEARRIYRLGSTGSPFELRCARAAGATLPPKSGPPSL